MVVLGRRLGGACAVVETELAVADFVELDSVECKYTSLHTTEGCNNSKLACILRD